MTAEEFDSTLINLSERKPFASFIVELQDGSRVEIDEPYGFAMRNGRAVTMTKGKKPFWFNHKTVARIVEGRVDSIAN